MIADGRIVEANVVWETLGYRVGELAGRPLAELVAESDRAAVNDAWSELGTGRSELRVLAADGDVRMTRPVEVGRADDGALSLVFVEVHPRKGPELGSDVAAALLEAHADVAQGVLIVELPRVLFANEAFCALSGYGADELRRLPSVCDLIVEEDRALLSARLDDRLRGATVPSHYTAAMLHKSGRRIMVELAVRARASDGRRRGVVLVRDTTDRYRTAARVIEADRLAQVGRRVADVVHEINNPLHNVLANLDAIGRCWRAPEEATRDLDVGALIDAAAVSAAEIRNIVSDLSVESRPDRESVMELDIAHVLNRALASIPHDLKARARVTQDLGDAPPVVTNESRLLQVFTNLLTNAFQALPEGRGGVHVSVCHDASRIIVEVADDGAGIAPEHLDHVFEPFFTTKPIGKGTGLGLAICLGIVRSLGGQITVESATGAGTRMRVSLPLVLGLPLSSRTSRPPG